LVTLEYICVYINLLYHCRYSARKKTFSTSATVKWQCDRSTGGIACLARVFNFISRKRLTRKRKRL